MSGLTLKIDTSIPALASASLYEVKGTDNGEGALLDFLHVIGETIGEISKYSGCILKHRSDVRTVDNNKIIQMDSTLPKISQ